VRIVLLTQTFDPDHAGVAVYATDLARFLAERGHHVTVVTSFPHYPSWRKRSADRGVLFRSEYDQGVRLLRGYVYVPASPTSWRRICYDLTFLTFASLNGLRMGAQDVVIAVSPPLLTGLLGWLLAVRSRCSLVVYVQDLQLDAALSLAMLKPGVMTRLLSRVERFIFERSECVVTISEGMRERIIAKGAIRKRVALIPNWIDLRAALRPITRGTFRARYHYVADSPLVAYAGNFGVKQSLHTLIDAARIIRDRAPAFRILLVGDGAARRALEARIAAQGLENVDILPVQSPVDYQALLEDLDIFVILQARGASEAFFPSKLLGVIARRCPLIIAADGGSELARVGRASGCAEIVPPENAEALAEMILALYRDLERRAALASNAEHFVRGFDRDRVLDRFSWLLVKLVGDSVPL